MKLFNHISPVKSVISRNRKLAVLVLLLLLIISLVLYLTAPKQSDVSMPLFYTLFILMLVSNFIYFGAKKKSNYLDFDTIFIFIYCLVGFSTTFFYNDELLFKALFIGFHVDEEYINRANLLFLIGLQSYLLGSLSKPNIIKSPNLNKTVVINTEFLRIFVIILTLTFLLSGGISFIRSIYDGSVDGGRKGISLHVLLLLITSAIALIATELYNKKISQEYRINKLTMSIILVLICLLLWCGSRTSASQLILPLICLYAMLFRNIKFKLFLVFIILGIVGMWIIQNIRSNVNISLDKINNPVVLITDLTIPSRTTSCALEYTNQYGYTYGKSMSLGVFGIIPFLPSLITKGDDEQFASALLLTKYTYAKQNIKAERIVGLGITITADIYLSFGLVGIVLLMCFLGYFINKYTLQTLSLNYYSTIIMAGMLANSIFLVRADYVYALRYVLWALFIAYINKSIVTSLNEEKKDNNLYTKP